MSYEYFNGEAVTPRTSITNPLPRIKRALIGLFGCRHKDVSRPFGRDGRSWRACLSCGARREFDAENWLAVGPYYYPEAR